MSIICNENVTCEKLWDIPHGDGTSHPCHRFRPAEGYALWRDNEEGNIDPETGEPWCYWWEIDTDKAEEYAQHIWAKLIDDTMEIYGDVEPEQPVMKARASTMSLRGSGKEVEDSHTYIDENGVERDKRGVY